MADAAAPEVGITIKATDRTGPGFASAQKGAQALEQKFNGLGGVVTAMPGKFSKAAGAMALVGGEMGKLGGAAGEVASKVTGLAGLLVAGGPFGVGLAVATGLLMAFTAVLDNFVFKTKDATDVVAEFNAATGAGMKGLKASREELLAINKDLHEFETTSHEEIMAGIDAQLASQQKMAEFHDKLAEKEKQRAEKAKKIREDGAKAAAEAAEIERAAAEHRHDEFVRQGEERLAASDVEFEAAVERAEALEEHQKELDEEKEARARAIAGHVEDMSRATTAILIADSEKARRAAAKAAVSMALDKIQAAAASGAASAAEGAIEEFPYPYNIIVAAVASAAVYAAISAFRAKVIGANTGGLIKGGVPGKDSVLTSLTPGELVIRAPVVQAVERTLLGAGPGGRGPGGMTVVNNNNYAMLDASQLTQTTRRRNARVQLEAQSELERRGMRPKR